MVGRICEKGYVFCVWSERVGVMNGESGDDGGGDP